MVLPARIPSPDASRRRPRRRPCPGTPRCDDASGTITRNVKSPGGSLAATTGTSGGVVLQPANLHGDITLQLPADTALAPVVLDCDEYSNARVGQAHTRYSRLGAKQRASETPGGLTLMGVRLHNPAS